MTSHIGQPYARTDGIAKVTGRARYSAEYPHDRLAHGFVVSSTITRGKITSIERAEALAQPGVLQIFTHENRPHLPWFDRSYRDQVGPWGSPFRPLYDAEILYADQPIALIVATTFEAARRAAVFLKVTYEELPHETNFVKERIHSHEPHAWTGRKPPPAARGDADKAFVEAAVRVDSEYHLSPNHHNPMEMHGTTACIEPDGSFVIYDKTQGVMNTLAYVTSVFGLSKKQVRIVAPYVGGAFGSALRPQYQLFLAVMAARELQRSVRVVLTRHQMFTIGHRPSGIQRVALGADADGRLSSIIHEALTETSRSEDYVEITVNWAASLYNCANFRASHEIVPLDIHTPADMRAPGGASGMCAIECAMDELAVAAGVDPLELRLRNYTERDPAEDKPFGSKELRAAYRIGSEKFGWAARSMAPGSMQDGDDLIGWGVATGMWEAMQNASKARARLYADGHLVVASATADIGTGTFTIMTQIAAETLGLPLEAVTFELGDSSLPMAPIEGGSWTAATVGSAVKLVCEKLAKDLCALAAKIDEPPFSGVKADELQCVDGCIVSRRDPQSRLTLGALLKKAGLGVIEKEATSLPPSKRSKFSHYVHSAVFVEVRVDRELGIIRVPRVVSSIAGGKILNPRTARSQILGGVVQGIGMALQEHTVTDHNLGRYVNHSFAEYHIPVNADIGEIDVIFVDEDDPHINALGVKGLGEIGIVGVAAAIANAVYHATGKRIREFPITLDRLLD